MKDPIFVSNLCQLLPGDLKGKVDSKTTQAEAATYFLDNVIKPTVDTQCGDTESFNILLSAMESYGSIPLGKLAQTIKEEIQRALGNSAIASEKFSYLYCICT